MKNEKILEIAAKVAENFKDECFFIGCRVDEVLPNDKISTLVCVDCSWLKELGHESPIIDRNDLDEVEDGGGYKDPSIKIDLEDIILTKWMDMIDADGDIHHCKVESFITMSDNPFNPVEGTDWVVYVEV